MGGLTLSAVVFDADGTLFDTERLMHDAWGDVCREDGFSRPWEEYLDFVGLNRAAVLARMEARYGSSFDGPGFMARCVRRLSESIEAEGVPLKPGARDVLELLHRKGIPAGLATSTHRVRTDRRLELCGLGPFFQTTVTGDEVAKGKPHPEIYQTACRNLGADPAHALAVEDSRNGIWSAHGAGMLPVMIPDLIPPAPDLDNLLFRRFGSLLELRDYLEAVL